jgi:tetratricopeptide (TPR) repeat protein
MRTFSIEDIRRCFASSNDFNEIFDAFQAALAGRIVDVELYRQLFANRSLTPDEIRLFGEKLAAEFPTLAYDVYLWLASLFEATVSSEDNYDLAFHYYQKAADVRPSEPEPYVDACDCHDPDLNIPPSALLIEFLNRGVGKVPDPRRLYLALARLYELGGDPERGELFRRKAEDPGFTPPATPAA